MENKAKPAPTPTSALPADSSFAYLSRTQKDRVLESMASELAFEKYWYNLHRSALTVTTASDAAAEFAARYENKPWPTHPPELAVLRRSIGIFNPGQVAK